MSYLIGAIVFARMSSSRLPGKSLVDINGRSLLGRVVDRSKEITINGPIILATSDHSTDIPLVSFAEEENLLLFRGSLTDVAGRALACAEQNDLDAFVRVCGDRPFHDPAIASKLVEIFENSAVDITTNCYKKTWPTGTACEVVSTNSLRHALAQTTEKLDREHLTRWFYRTAKTSKIINLESPDPSWADISLAIDTLNDLEFSRKIATIADAEGLPGIARIVKISKSISG